MSSSLTVKIPPIKEGTKLTFGMLAFSQRMTLDVSDEISRVRFVSILKASKLKRG